MCRIKYKPEQAKPARLIYILQTKKKHEEQSTNCSETVCGLFASIASKDVLGLNLRPLSNKFVTPPVRYPWIF